MNATVPSTFRSVPSRRTRRLSVAVFAAGLLTVMATSLVHLWSPAARDLALRLLFLGGVLLTLFGAARLALPAMQGLQSRRAGQLDERQQLRSLQALAAAYRTVALLLLALVGALTFVAPAVTSRLLQPGSLGSAGLLFALVFVLAALPSAILAWTEPDGDTSL